MVLRTYDKLFRENVFSAAELKNIDHKRFAEMDLNDENVVGRLVVRQLRRLFVSYSMAINKQENRIGNLFDPKYKRLEITNEDYLKYVLFYTHYNPEKHGLIDDFRNYHFSSYQSILKKQETKINRNLIFEIYGSKDSFLNYHSIIHDERENLIIE